MERFALAGVMLLVMATAACHEVDGVTAPPLIDWDPIVVATVHPTEPTSNDPEICTTMYEAWENETSQEIWDTCEAMSNNFRDLVLAPFDHEDFRSGDLNCQDMETALTSVLGNSEKRSRGEHGTMGGLSAVDELSEEAYGVWFNEKFQLIPVEDQMLTAGHEAYHLAFFDGDHDNADQAAEYCFGYSEEHPWGPE